MGRKSITGGVIPAGLSRIRFDFTVDGRRFRPTLSWVPNETNLQRARTHLARINAQIAAGTFCFSDEFPRYRGLQKLPPALQHRTCGEIFDDFLRHEEARLARGDLAPATVASHRKILDHVWRPHLADVPFLGVRYSMLIKIADAYTCNKKTYNNAVSALRRAFDFGYLDYPERRDPAASLKCARIGKNDRPPIDPFRIQDAEVLIAAIHGDWGEAQGNYDELRFFTGLRPSEEIALVITDYDAAHGVLSITKARVLGVDKDVTKTGEDRRIRLCRRAITVIERQLRLRERLAREGGHRSRSPVLHGLGPTDLRSEISVHPLAAHAPAPCHSLSQAVYGAAHVGKLEPDGRAQSPVGGKRARSSSHHNAIRGLGLDGRRRRSGHHRDSRCR